MRRVSVFAFESQPVVIRGLEACLAGQPDLEWSGAAATPADALDQLRIKPADVVLVDQTAGLRPALQFITDLRELLPTTQSILWTQDLAEIDTFRVIQMGARAVLKRNLPLEQLLDCVRTVAEGGVWLDGSSSPNSAPSNLRPSVKLTPREREIATFVCRGLRNREIAERLSITPGTVKVHLMHIFEKTGVKDRFELAIHGRQLLGLNRELLRAESAVPEPVPVAPNPVAKD
jgi:DNA-binding NarL/FixJ family response regulator